MAVSKKSLSKHAMLLAVDPSLSSTGWVLFHIETEKPLACGLIKSLGVELPLAKRLNVFQDDVSNLYKKIKLGMGDILICEGPAPLVVNPLSAIKVEHVRGIFESLARARGVNVPGRVNPRTLQIELLGLRGKQVERKLVKKIAKETAKRLFGDQLDNVRLDKGRAKTLSQDIIDAALIGILAIPKIKLCSKLEVDLTEAFVEGRRVFKKRGRSGVRWNETDI